MQDVASYTAWDIAEYAHAKQCKQATRLTFRAVPQAIISAKSSCVSCRVFMWGAKSGVEQLPPFPEPSHNAKKTKSGHSLPVYVKNLCVVQFQTAAAEENALPVVGYKAACAIVCLQSMAAASDSSKRLQMPLLYMPLLQVLPSALECLSHEQKQDTQWFFSCLEPITSHLRALF